jgi:hypothetical protein
MASDSRSRLDDHLLRKIAESRNKSDQYIREQISKRAARLGITSEAAQILIARELGLGTARALRKLPPHAQEQLRRVPEPLLKPQTTARQRTPGRAGARFPKPELAAIDMLTDEALKSRCADLLKARRHFDRVFREATTVLDDRIKKKSGIKRMSPVALIGKALNPNPNKSVLIVSDEAAVQEGIHSICKGLMLAFRDPAHHELNDQLTRSDAIKLCGFVDTILALIGAARVREPGLVGSAAA